MANNLQIYNFISYDDVLGSQKELIMKQKIALIVSGLIFLIIAIAHAGRLIWHVAITVSGETLPMNVSVIGMIVALLLSLWMFTACKSK